jgi:DNA polymerase-3 subunit delta'
MPHALLIHEAPGSGGEWLARWIAQLMLCSRRSPEPCGLCVNCQRVANNQHPDLALVQPLEESRQLRIEQVRELSEELALTSHQGGYKVGLLSPADSLNRFAANALLKTLEEPAPRTLLILVTIEPSRLPATILSRCQRIRIRAPARSESVRWLQATKGEGDWNAVLDILGEAPLLAGESDPAEAPRLGSEMRNALNDLTAGGTDPVATAERWSRADLPLRLRCFENWLTDRIRSNADPRPAAVEKRASVHLPRAAAPLTLRGLFELMDGVRELKAALDTPLNKSLALEGLLRRLTPT